MCLKKYDITNITNSPQEEHKLRNKKWGFGKVYTNEIADIQLCSEEWNNNKNKVYPEINIYKVPTKIILLYIKKYRSPKRFLSSWWVDETLNRPLTGLEKWEFLMNSIKTYGWDHLQPACIRIRSFRPPVVVNGHHRIAVADYLNLTEIPINFLYS